MARAHSVYVVTINHRVTEAYTVKYEMTARLKRRWDGKCPTNLRVLRVRDGELGEAVDITAEIYGLANED